MKISYANPDKENWFLVSWALSNKCNYRCTYCPDFLHNGSSGQPKWEVVEKFIRSLKIKDKEICYRITGGEPTFWKRFIDMAKLVKEEGHTFSFITNGSQSVDYYKKIDPYTDGMIISYHHAYADVQKFIDIANNTKMEIAVNLMMPNDIEGFKEAQKVAATLYDNTDRLAIWPKVILDKTSGDYITNEVSVYTEEQKEIISKWPYFRKLDDSHLHRGEIFYNERKIDANELIVEGLNKHKGWKCWAGLDMIYIEWGKIFRAECLQGGLIGTLEDFTLPQKTVICNKELCGCLSDIYLRKELIK